MTSEPTSQTIARAPEAHFKELDGLRAAAIWLVLGVHLFFTAPATEQSRSFLPAPLGAILSHGWLGVDLFFVLSGFLITRILLATKSQVRNVYFRRFYSRRAARILPLYVAVLVILVVIKHGQYLQYFLLCAFFSANLADFFHARIPDVAGPYWSLAVEEQFYLIWPWLVLWFDNKRLTWLTAAILLAEPILRYGIRSQDLILTWYRLDGLGLGAFIAVRFANGSDRREAIRLAVTFFSIDLVISIVGIPLGLLHEGTTSVSLRVTQAVLAFGTILVLAINFTGHPALAFLRGRITTVTAALSFCLYLIHKPIISAVAALLTRLPLSSFGPQASLVIRSILSLTLAYGIALLSRRFFELPFIRMGQKLPRIY